MSKRVTLEFSDKAFEKLSNLQDLCDYSTRSELIRNALRLFEEWAEKKREGYKFVLEKGDKQCYFYVII